jgi:hypothetical protein
MVRLGELDAGQSLAGLLDEEETGLATCEGSRRRFRETATIPR